MFNFGMMFWQGIPFTQIREKGLLYFLILVVIIGIFLRCINLDQKPYWFDETYSMLRASSYSEQEVRQDLFTGEVIQAGDFLKYQAPSSQKGALGTITGLAKEEPQLPPLYFLLARFWAQSFGSSKVAMRSLSVIGSLLSFPVIYWLCLELFKSPIVGWMTMALFAVSPINLRYAQEIRQYSLWLTLILLSCIFILRALRQPTKLDWSLYTICIVTALYCHLLTGLVMIAHGLYILCIDRFRLTRQSVAYSASFAISIAFLLPWCWFTWQNRSNAAKMLAWAATSMPFSNLMQGAGTSLSHAFFAWHLNYHYPFVYLAIPILILICCALLYLWRHAPTQIWLFILILTATTSFPFLFADLALGGRRILSERYFLVSYVSIFIAVAYLLTSKLSLDQINSTSNLKQSRVWQWITVFLLSGSILSCGIGSFSQTWWGWSEFDLDIPSIVQQTPDPLVISDMPPGIVMPLARQLNPHVNMQLLSQVSLDQFALPDRFSHIFLYNPGGNLLSLLQQQNHEIERVYHLRDPATTNQFSLYYVNPLKNAN